MILLLLSANFEHVWFRSERRSFSLDSLSTRMQGKSESESWLHRIEFIRRLMPQPLRRRKFRLPSGTAVVAAIAAAARPERVISIVVPVFNERATFQEMMDGLLRSPCRACARRSSWSKAIRRTAAANSFVPTRGSPRFVWSCNPRRTERATRCARG